MYKRKYFHSVIKRLKEERKFIQILSGPRQTGKTTIIHQVIGDIEIPSFYASADDVSANTGVWIEQQWETARIKLRTSSGKEILLVLDEIQKIADWSDTVKRLWDEDTINSTNIRVVLLGSSPLLIQKGLTESLAGRFEMIRIPHWSYAEMRDAFDLSLEQYIYYGGYPGSVALIDDESRWKQYIRDSLIETSISKDILMMTRIDKPSLLKRLFEIGCIYSGQILSFNKILGQLHDAGNTTTLSHYLELLDATGLLAGLQKYSPSKITERSSSPKFQVLNNALLSSQMNIEFEGARLNTEQWGRLVESTVGAHLINTTRGSDIKVNYWRERNREVDFVLLRGEDIVGIEVKSGRERESIPGIDAFSKKFSPVKVLLVGRGGMALDEFLSYSPDDVI
jgi:predicted AAA+ superfamily ATPase